MLTKVKVMFLIIQSNGFIEVERVPVWPISVFTTTVVYVLIITNDQKCL